MIKRDALRTRRLPIEISFWSRILTIGCRWHYQLKISTPNSAYNSLTGLGINPRYAGIARI